MSVLKESLKAMDAELQKTKTELLGTKTELQGTEMELEGRKAELRQLRASLNSVGKRDACQNVSSRKDCLTRASHFEHKGLPYKGIPLQTCLLKYIRVLKWKLKEYPWFSNNNNNGIFIKPKYRKDRTNCA